MILIQFLLWLLGIALGGFVAWRGVASWSKNTSRPLPYGAFAEGIALLLVCGAIASAFGEVPAGYRGVVLRFSATTGEIKQPGLYFIIPYIERVVPMNVQVQAYSVTAAAASKDLQNVTTNVTLNYSIDPGKVVDIYNRLGQDYQDRVITPAVQESTKASTAQFTAEELITKRPLARNLLDSNLRQRIGAFDIDIAAVSITNFEFSPEFSQAIEQKVVAYQSFLRSQNVLRQVQVEAQQKITAAEGDARANALRRAAISPLTVQYDAIQKWDGHLPLVTSGAIPLINLGTLPSEAK